MTQADPRDAIVEHLPAMRAFAVSLARNSALADDLVQDTIVKAWINFEKFDSQFGELPELVGVGVESLF